MNNLSPLEIDQIQKLLHDDVLLNITKKVFYQTVAKNIPKIREGQSNELLGQKYRAYEEAKGLIETAFIDLNSYLKVGSEDKNTNLNKGR